MPRGKKTTEKREAPKFEELVAPDGEHKETPLNVARDVQLRFQGYLPAEQAKLESPGRGDSGSSSLAGDEKTVSTPTPTGDK